jgi:hypothetical protein
MTKRSWIDALRERLSLLASGWRGSARVAWCIRQQRALAGADGRVVWVRSAELEWAIWGARRGLFAIERMDGLSYLRLAASSGGSRADRRSAVDGPGRR